MLSNPYYLSALFATIFIVTSLHSKTIVIESKRKKIEVEGNKAVELKITVILSLISFALLLYNLYQLA